MGYRSSKERQIADVADIFAPRRQDGIMSAVNSSAVSLGRGGYRAAKSRYVMYL